MGSRSIPTMTTKSTEYLFRLQGLNRLRLRLAKSFAEYRGAIGYPLQTILEA